MTGRRSSSSRSVAVSSVACLRCLVPALALLFALAASTASAQTAGGDAGGLLDGRPIGVVDMGVIQRSEAIARVRQAIDEQSALFDQEIAKEEVALKEAEAQLNADKDLITEEEFNTRLAEFEERVVGLQREIQLQRSSFDRAYADAQNRLEEEMLLIISELAADRGFALVIQKKDAVIFDTTLDITAEALSRLNARTSNLTITLERIDNSLGQ